MPDNGAAAGQPTLETFGDYVCPFSWLAEPVIRDVCAALDVARRRRAFELRPLPAPYADERYCRRIWEQGVLPIARTLGIETKSFPTLRTRTRKAHEAAAFAERHGRGDALHAALFAACFDEGLDIGRIDVLIALGERVGLDAMELQVALDTDQHGDDVSDDRARAAALGVTGLPAFALDTDGRTVTRVGWCAAAELRGWIEENLETVRG